ncbi:MAG: hypothetical protein HOA17_06180 [Candidatus Melainabacteria bacterium]|jgi:hypothetical protein|nr:hypothetical protein [Candidatus Melainabacteria bacterium]
MSSKYQALLKTKTNIALAEAEDENAKFAHHLIKCLDKGSDWLQIETIKNLKYFSEFDFVRKSLICKYQKTDSIKVKQAIKDLHDGLLNTSDIDQLIQDYSEPELIDDSKEKSPEPMIDSRELQFRKNQY